MNKAPSAATPALKAVALILPAAIAYALCLYAPFHLADKKALLGVTALHQPWNIYAIINFDPYLPRPLFHFSLALDWWLWNGHPWGFHLTNLMMHLAAVLLFWGVVGKYLENTDGGTSIAFSTALLFSIHPILTESVTYIWGGSGVMSAVFILLSALLYLQARDKNRIQPIWILMSFIAFAAAMASKETSAILPAILVAIEISDRKSESTRNAVARTLPFLLLVVAFIIWRHIEYGKVLFYSDGSYFSHLLRQTRIAAEYLRLMSWPFGISVIHFVPDSYPLTQVSISFLFIAGIATGAILSLRRQPAVWLAGTLFFCGLAPYYFVPLADRMVERNLYIPTMGFALFLAWAVNTTKTQRKYVLITATALCFFAGTIAGNRVWLTEQSLWDNAALNAPQDARPFVELGALAIISGKGTEAERFLNVAVRLDPRNADAHNDLGILYTGRGDMSGAEYAFTLAVNADVNNTEAHLNLIRAMLSLGKKDQAISQLEKLVKRFPNFAEPKALLGDIYRIENRSDEAIRLLEDALRLDPENTDAIINVGLAYIRKRDDQTARTWLEKALKIKPDSPDLHRALGIMYMQEEDLESAAKEYQKAVQLSKTPNPDMIADWGIILMQAKHFQEARDAFERERQIRPTDPRPYMRLAYLEEKAGNILPAKFYYEQAQRFDVDGKYKADIEASLKRLESAPQQ